MNYRQSQQLSGLIRRGAALASLTLCACLLLAACSGAASGAQSSGSHSSAAQAIGDQPVLGGSLQAFLAAYPVGKAISLEGLNPNFDAYTETARDGSDHIRGITFKFGADYQSDAHVETFIAHFFPHDAMKTGDQTIKNGVYHFYSSQDLAATFDASHFTHSDGTAAQPGSFVWDCYGGFSGGDCDLTFENQ